MRTAEHEVANAVHALGLTGQVRQVHDPERSRTIAAITDRFLEHPRVRFWWEWLSVPHASRQTERGYEHIPQIAPQPDDLCWFVVGLEDDSKGLFECRPRLLPGIIGECFCFEYAVVDRELSWILIENHHDFLIAAGAPAVERLERLKTATPDG